MPPTPPQRHPSRDPDPVDYQVITNPHTRGEEFHIRGAGYYEPQELDYATAEGDIPRVMQGRLFDPVNFEKQTRRDLGAQRLQTSDPAEAGVRDRALDASRVPSLHLQSRPQARPISTVAAAETEFTTKDRRNDWTTSSGYYQGPAGTQVPDVLAVSSEHSVVHELGHRRHLGTRAADETLHHPRGRHPDPLKEGVADAYEDRYGGPGSDQVQAMKRSIGEEERKFTSYADYGYSTNAESSLRRGWRDDDRALYAATRAHASETGEQPSYVPRSRLAMEEPGLSYSGGGDPTIDATLHHLLSTSPHAAQALRQTGLKEAGSQAFRRQRDRQLLTQGQEIQGSLFDEVRGSDTNTLHGYTPSLEAGAPLSSALDEMEHFDKKAGENVKFVHMNTNQFGEKPRSARDVSGTLGVQKHIAKRRGFTND